MYERDGHTDTQTPHDGIDRAYACVLSAVLIYDVNWLKWKIFRTKFLTNLSLTENVKFATEKSLYSQFAITAILPLYLVCHLSFLLLQAIIQWNVNRDCECGSNGLVTEKNVPIYCVVRLNARDNALSCWHAIIIHVLIAHLQAIAPHRHRLQASILRTCCRSLSLISTK